MSKFKSKKYCIAAGCNNNDKNWSQFFSIPSTQKDSKRCQKWLLLLRREDLLKKLNKKELNVKSYYVCSAHFDPSSLKSIQKLTEDAVPTMHLESNQQPVSTKSREAPIVLSKSSEGGTSHSTMPSTSAQALVISNKLANNIETQTNEQILSEQQTRTSKTLTEATLRKRKLSGFPTVVPSGVKDARTVITPQPSANVCSVFGCRNSQVEHLFKLFYPLPACETLRTKWLELINRSDLKSGQKSKDSRVCADHFDASDLAEGGLKPDAVPHLKLPRRQVLHATSDPSPTTSGLPPDVPSYGGIIDLARTVRTPQPTSKVCCVFGCRNNQEEHPGKMFFGLPPLPGMRLKWLQLINRLDLQHGPRAKDSKVCSDHFDRSQLCQGWLRPGALPHLLLPRTRVPIVYAPDPNVSGFLPRTTTVEVKKEPVDPEMMEIEIQLEPEQDTNNYLTPSPFLSAIIQQNVRDTDPLPQISQIVEPAPKIIKVEHVDPTESTLYHQKPNKIIQFYKKATFSGVEIIDIPPVEVIKDTNTVHVQTTKVLIDKMNVPLIKEHKAEVRELKTQIKYLEDQMKAPQWEKKKFLLYCDEYLDPKISGAVKAHTTFQERYKGNRYSNSFKNLAINLYLSSKQSYNFLGQFFNLPTLTTIRRFQLPVKTGVNQYLIDKFKVKVDQMTEKEKICAVCFDYVGLKKSLFYDVTNDFLCGIQDIDQVLGSEPAQFGVLLMARGLYSKWKQPISFSLVSERTTNPALQVWTLKIINLLIDIGLNVKAFVADMENGFLDFSGVTSDVPYFMVGEKKIYHFFDVPSLYKSARDDLMQFNFHFSTGVAKWAHILKVYEIDKEEELSLMPKITEEHVRPNEEAKEKVKLAVDMFSETVAAVINFHVKTKLVPMKLKETAEFLVTMSRLYELLTSQKTTCANELKEAFKATAKQTEFLSEALEYLQTLEMKDENGQTMEKMKFVDGLAITIMALICLSDDLKTEGIPYILTKKLSKDCTEMYFAKARQIGGNSLAIITPIRFTRSFQRLFLSSLVSNAKEGSSDIDLKALMEKISDYVKSEDSNDEPEYDTVKLPVGVTDYQKLWPVPSPAFITGYLLKKCIEKYFCCKKLVEVLCEHYKLENTSDVDVDKGKVLECVEEYKVANMKKKNLTAPPEYLVELVEKMDDMYNDYYRKINVETYGFGSNFYKQIEDLVIDKPCPCFPFKYFKFVFIRMKIYHTIKAGNKSADPQKRRRKR